MKTLTIVALLIIGIVIMATNSVVLYAASGDKTFASVIPYRNVSSSTKPASCIKGDLKRNDTYIFLCASSSHWRRIAIGNGF